MSWTFDYDSPQAIKMVLEAQDMAMQKRFGQNFLISARARERIADAVGASEGTTVWEIGPGMGALTSLLLARGARVTAFEIDHGFCRILREFAFRDESRFELVEGDALKTMGQRRDVPERICGNLPYNVGTAVIASILEGVRRPPVMVFTLQKEVVARLCAPEKSEEWSTLSILCQNAYECRPLFTLKPGCFWPAPEVTSTVVAMTRRSESRVDPRLQSDFSLIVRDLFAQKRKTIKNNLLSGKAGGRLMRGGVLALIEKSGVDPRKRAEDLGWDELNALTAAYHTLSANCPSGSTQN